jgi:hypothetical protein
VDEEGLEDEAGGEEHLQEVEDHQADGKIVTRCDLLPVEQPQAILGASERMIVFKMVTIRCHSLSICNFCLFLGLLYTAWLGWFLSVDNA